MGRLYVNKANLVAMNATLTEQLGLVKVAGTLQKSTQVTTLVNNLMRAPELQQTVVQMQKEMMKVRVWAWLVQEPLFPCVMHLMGAAARVHADAKERMKVQGSMAGAGKGLSACHQHALRVALRALHLLCLTWGVHRRRASYLR